MKFSFTLDDDDLKYFQRLLRDAKRFSRGHEPSEIIAAAQGVVTQARKSPRLPTFAEEAIDTLESLTNMVEDKEWGLPKSIANRVVAALAYFAHPEDLIPDHIPGLGFLDDAIMIKIVEQDFTHELWGYSKFCKYRDGLEQRPWTSVAQERRPRRLKERRDLIREEIDVRREKAERKGRRSLLPW